MNDPFRKLLASPTRHCRTAAALEGQQRFAAGFIQPGLRPRRINLHEVAAWS